MNRGRKPSRPPCSTCGKPPVCYKAPYYRCNCGRFVLRGGKLYPVTERGRPVGKKAVVKRQVQGPVEQVRPAMTWEEFEALQDARPERVRG